MEANPYLPPAAALAEPSDIAGVEAPVFAVSITKFVVMNVFTGGTYQLYWFYRHWVAYRRRTGEAVWPVWRTFFGIFWCHSLLSQIHEQARKLRIERWISTGSLTAGWVITNLLSRLPDPWWLVSCASFVFLIPSQREANELVARTTPGADPNSRFTAGNIAWMVLFSLFWTLVVIGLILPDTPPS